MIDKCAEINKANYPTHNKEDKTYLTNTAKAGNPDTIIQLENIFEKFCKTS